MSEDPTTESPTPEAPEVRRLTRSGKDAVIGGVAGGLGRYFGIDPILFRIGFVALSFIGGIGVLAYIALLAFVPTDGEERPGGTSRGVAVAGAVVLGVALVTFLGTPALFFGPALLIIGVVALAGVLLWRAVGAGADGDPARTAARIAIGVLLAVAIAGAALGVGLAAALGGGVVIGSLAVLAGLVMIGTAFVGGARWLIVPALALVLPLGFVAAAGIDMDGGVGDRDYRPAGVADMRDRYEIGMGGLGVDLRDVDLPPGRTDVGIDVGIGEAVVYVPREACVTSDVEIGAGAMDMPDHEQGGLDLTLASEGSAPVGRPRLHIDVDIGLGVIEVVREGYLRDRFDDGRFSFDGDRFDDQGGTGCA
jgi:phage shock protein PspC (stress-responsive transcriptional regulator)